MNIFATNPCPVKSAKALDDRRLVKMILESCQIMGTVAAIHGLWREPWPRPTHEMHPCTLWAATRRQNFDWLWEHANAMDNERQRRWGRANGHKTLVACVNSGLWDVRKHMDSPDGGFSTHVNCARNRELGIDFTQVPDVYRAYRMYLTSRWRRDNRPAICTIPISRRQRKAK